MNYITLRSFLTFCPDQANVDIKAEGDDRPEAHISGSRVMAYQNTCKDLLNCKVMKIEARDSRIFVTVDPHIDPEKVCR